MRNRAGLGEQVLRDPAVTDSAELPDDVRPARRRHPRGHHRQARPVGPVGRARRGRPGRARDRADLPLDRRAPGGGLPPLGSIAGRAIGYLAPEVALGGAIVPAGLIETDALDRDDVAAYLNELAASNPELMDHVASGGGGCSTGCRCARCSPPGCRSAIRPSGRARRAARARRRGMPHDSSAALRDVAGGVAGRPADPRRPASRRRRRAAVALEDLMATLDAGRPGRVHARRPAATSPTSRPPAGPRPTRARAAPGRWRPPPYADLVARHRAGRRRRTRRAVMLVGSGAGGVTAAEIAALRRSPAVRRRPGGHRGRPVRPGAAGPRRAPGCSRSRTAPTRSRCSARWSTPAPTTGSRSSSTAAGTRRRRASTSRGARAADAAARPAPRRARPAARARPDLAPRPSLDLSLSAQRMSCTNSPSWVRLRHSTIGTTSP